MWNLKGLLAVLATVLSTGSIWLSARNPLTPEDFFEVVSYRDVEVSPDGLAVAIETVRPDWQENRFRHELWLYRHGSGGKGSLVQITRSGYEHDPQWSPDSRWIAFLSDQSMAESGAASPGKSSGHRESTESSELERSGSA